MPVACEQMRVNEASAYLGVSRSSLYRLVNQRLIRRVKVRGIVRFRKQELDRFLERHEREKR